MFRKIFPLGVSSLVVCSLWACFLCLMFSGCDEPVREVEPVEETTSQTEATILPASTATEDAAVPAKEEPEITEPYTAELEAIKAAWQHNAEKYNEIKAVLEVEYISPPIYEEAEDEAELQERLASVKPEDYTIKEWRESVWLNGLQFRKEREITRHHPKEFWFDTQVTYDGLRELHSLTVREEEQAPSLGSVDARSPGELNNYWPAELEPFYKVVRNADDYDHVDFWNSLQVIGEEEYKEETCLVVQLEEEDREQVEYTVSPQTNYHIVKYRHLENGVPSVTGEIQYRKTETGWVPTKWETIQMKAGEDGPFTVKAMQANVTVSEFQNDFEHTQNLYSLLFPVGAQVRMWGSSDLIPVVASVPEEEQAVPDPIEPLNVSAIVEEVIGTTPEEKNTEGLPATHKPVDKITATYNDKPINLNTFCLDREGNILLSCGGEVQQLVLSEEEKKLLDEEGEDAKVDASVESSNSVILVYSPEMKLQKTIKLPFKATALTSFDDSSLMIGGEGRLARIDRDGNVLHSGSSPQIDDIDSYREKLTEAAKKERAEVMEYLKEDLITIQKQLDILEKTKEEDRSRGQKRTMLALQGQINLINQHLKQDQKGVDPQFEMMMQMKLRVPALSVTEKDIFVTVPSLEGYGFEVWRVDHQFQNPEMIISDLRGCCGQMDVQAKDDKIYVAENGRFRVASFDREGERLNSFGKSDRSSKEGFGSCCNPMNVRCCSNGDILTAESSVGNIKRFSPEGELLANIGHVTVTGGCKNVAIEYDEARDRYYMMDLPNHTIHALHSIAPTSEVTLNVEPNANSQQQVN
ncbi:hypothetical protein Pla110_03370 [Polystyrenella longa]|uniref:Uncharacterized protein n=1 Tax=Polystyrenella longa TaxID=2528007 RepID=A0A518CHD2_9PLAN|nr:hypothetical protein [Polystyrenella longa]QDU78633.1 hypothetical protein Pla110_03370 [Polystyrenella longa]